MTLLDFLQRTGVEQPLPRPVLEIFENREPQDLTESLSQQRPSLRLVAPEELYEFIIARHAWLAWRNAADAVQATLEEAGKPPLSDEQLAGALHPDELRAYVWASEIATDPAQEAALFALWRIAVTATLADGELDVSMTRAKHPRADAWHSRLGAAGKLSELDDRRWLELRQGVRGGVVKIELEAPLKAICEQAAEPLAALAALLGRKKPRTFVKEQVLPRLVEEVLTRKHTRVEETLARAAAVTYAELLGAPPQKTFPLAAVYVGSDRQRVAMCIIDKRGAVAATAPIRPSGKWTERVERWIRDHRAKLVALPNEAAAATWLTELHAALEPGRARVMDVHVAGLIEARSIDDPALRRVSTEEASAIVLARRAFRPLDEWCRIDPIKLGLIPLQAEHNVDRVRELLQITRERVIADNQPMSTAPVTTGGIRGRSSQPLNPEIRGIRDLRPGLSLQGVITNVTKFGAFVNIGLRQEGLVHISELSDEFVNDPNEVVQTGQRVTTRVISVDLERGRIALSMRTESAMPRGGGGGMRRAPRPRPGGGPPRPGGGANSAERSKALQDLENLFRK